MQTSQHEKLSDREFYFVLYMMMLFVVGWFMDINGAFLAKYFTLANMIMIPTIGGLVGLFIMSLGENHK
ncbi:DUF3925 family protein [Bacillus manliponensis]|uniref:DUF3925 family protein n=1 Tax=Bacillus manliponensis TaxID=574376 RepID=UPI00351271AD